MACYKARFTLFFSPYFLSKYRLSKAKRSSDTVTFSTLISDTLSLFSLKARDHVSCLFKAAGEIVVLYTLISTYLEDSQEKD
jgi:hypothetical protein